MRCRWLAVLALAGLVPVACAGSPSSDDRTVAASDPQAPAVPPAAVPPAAARDADHAFVHVAVVTMDSPDIARDQTVLVSKDTIVAIGPHLSVPPHATVIDGTGKYLIPGLHDMHVHLDGTRGMLALFVGAGVTTVRNMSGSPRILALRQRVAHGDLLGPTIYTAGPFVDGARPRWESSDVVARPRDAERVIAAQAAAGYDFVKVYNGLTLASFDAVVAAAREHHLRVVGHVPFAVPLAHALASGMVSIEHLTGYEDAIARTDSPLRYRHSRTSILRGWLYTDPARIPVVAADTARAGVWSCPTLVSAVVYGDLWRGRIPAATELEVVSPDWRARWDPAHLPRRPVLAVRRAMEQVHDRELDDQLAIVRELSRAGAPLLAGTDTPNPYVVPGASLHQELELLAEAGLTPYTALRAATSDAARFLGDPHDGHIAPGAHADLVLLDGNPLEDLRALDHIDGVMVRGKWLAADELRAMHDGMVAEYKAPAWLAPIDLHEPGARELHYVVSDNGAAIGAYAMARKGDTVTEQQTLEDETVTVHTTFVHGRASTVALDVDRTAGLVHAEHVAVHHGSRLLGWFAPATALEVVAHLDLEEDGKITYSIEQPARDAPDELREGELEITRQPDAAGGERVYRLHVRIENGSWIGRVVLDLDGQVRELRMADTSRPVVRTWRRRR